MLGGRIGLEWFGMTEWLLDEDLCVGERGNNGEAGLDLDWGVSWVDRIG